MRCSGRSDNLTPAVIHCFRSLVKSGTGIVSASSAGQSAQDVGKEGTSEAASPSAMEVTRVVVESCRSHPCGRAEAHGRGSQEMFTALEHTERFVQTLRRHARSRLELKDGVCSPSPSSVVDVVGPKIIIATTATLCLGVLAQRLCRCSSAPMSHQTRLQPRQVGCPTQVSVGVCGKRDCTLRAVLGNARKCCFLPVATT